MARRGRPPKNPRPEEEGSIAVTESPAPPVDEEKLQLREQLLEQKEVRAKLDAEVIQLQQELDRFRDNPYLHIAQKIVNRVRNIAHERCDCKRKAFLKVCERWSCKHLILVVKEAEEQLIRDGHVGPVNYQKPRGELTQGRVQSVSTSGFPDMDAGWESTTRDPNRPMDPIQQPAENQYAVRADGKYQVVEKQ